MENKRLAVFVVKRQLHGRRDVSETLLCEIEIRMARRALAHHHHVRREKVEVVWPLELCGAQIADDAPSFVAFQKHGFRSGLGKIGSAEQSVVTAAENDDIACGLCFRTFQDCTRCSWNQVVRACTAAWSARFMNRLPFLAR